VKSRRVVVFLALVVAALITAVTIAVPSSAPSSADSLVLNGRTPQSVELAVSLSTGATVRATGTIVVNALTSAAVAHLEVPVVTAPTAFEVRAIGHHLYLTSPNLANAAGPVWYQSAVNWPSLSGLAHYLVHPNAAVLTLLANSRITHRGQFTVYEYARANLSLAALGAANKHLAGILRVRLTTGRQGEVTALWIEIASGSSTTSLSLTVLAYNVPAVVAVPRFVNAPLPAGPLLSQFLGSGALGSLVLPSQFIGVLQRQSGATS